ncbi:hypothetical protein [Mameliella sediminis]|nr:hypothetical protein [Mameliella sediminis]
MAEITLRIAPRRWWRCLGFAGLLMLWAGLRLGLPLRVFFRVGAA